MPIISSALGTIARRITSENEHRQNDVNRLLAFLGSGEGAIFAAKQVMLDPKSAPARLASIFAQAGLNRVPFGGGNIGFNPNQSFIQGTAEVPSAIRTRASVYQQALKPSLGGYVTADEQTSSLQISTGSIRDELSKNILKNNSVVGISGEDNLLTLDTVPFYFTPMMIGSEGVVPGFSLPFLSFFDSISDSANGGWNSFTYTGRGEQFHVYQNYSRNLSINFKVAAFTKTDLEAIHKKLNILRSFTKPTYSEYGYMRGTILQLTVGNFVNNLPGFLTNLSFSVDTNTPWEIDDRTQILPHVVTITAGYTVIESETPQTEYPISQELQTALDLL